MNINNRQQRCIELFSRLKSQFLRVAVLDNAESGVQSTKKSDNYFRQNAARDAALFITLLARLTSHMDLDDFNTHWYFYADYVYQDEDSEAQECVQSEAQNRFQD